MATKSILENINIKDGESGKDVVIALEQAAEKAGKDVVLSSTYKDIRSKDIKQFFDRTKIIKE